MNSSPDLDERLFTMASGNGTAHAEPAPDDRRARIVHALRSPRLLNLVLAALAAVLAASVAVASVNRQPPIYASAAAVLVDQPKQLLQSDAEGIILKLNLLRQKYAALAQTELIARPVAAKLGVSPGLIAGSVFVVPYADSLVFYVSAHGRTPELSQQIAEAVAEQLIAYNNQDQDVHQIPPDQRIVLSVVTKAGLGGKVEPTKKRALNDGVASALVAMALTYVLLQLLFARRKD